MLQVCVCKGCSCKSFRLDATQPPNPDRSFADVTSNKDYPTPEHDTTQPTSDLPPLSDLPDVKDMLEKPSGKCI